MFDSKDNHPSQRWVLSTLKITRKRSAIYLPILIAGGGSLLLLVVMTYFIKYIRSDNALIRVADICGVIAGIAVLLIGYQQWRDARREASLESFTNGLTWQTSEWNRYTRKSF